MSITGFNRRRRMEAEGLMGTTALTPAEVTLIGSDKLPATTTLPNGNEVTAGDVVARAHKDSALSVEDWNQLPQEERDLFIDEALLLLQQENPAQGNGEIKFDLTGFSRLKKDDMVEYLTGKVEIPAEATKADLIELAKPFLTE